MAPVAQGRVMTADAQTHGPLGKKVVRAFQKHLHEPVVDIREFAKMKKETDRLFDSLATAEHLKDLEPVHAAYVLMLNRISLLIEILSQLPALAPLVKIVSEAEETYLPDGPPMSPLTHSYFGMWSYFDAAIGPHRETFGTCLVDAGRLLGMNSESLRLLQTMQDSRMGLYVHEGSEGPRQILRELVTSERKSYLVPAGYIGRPGEIWLARTLPPPSSAFEHGLVFITPYVMRKEGEREWQAFLKRILPTIRASDSRAAYGELMKWGLSLHYWNEFIFEAYCGHEEEVVYLTGLPDVPTSRPHNEANPARLPARVGEKRHRFTLNSHSDARFTRCPLCEKPTKLRKLVLAIDIAPDQLLAQGLTCRYCPRDDLIIVHQDVLEAQLAAGIGQQKPALLGHAYQVVGTFETPAWREGLRRRKTSLEQLLTALHPFREVLKVEPARWGWYPADKPG